MALVLNEEQQMLRESAKTFIQESSPVSALRQLRDNGDEWSPELWAGMAEMGWTGITIPEAFDGLEFGYVGRWPDCRGMRTDACSIATGLYLGGLRLADRGVR